MKYLLHITLILLCTVGFAQQIDYNLIILPTNASQIEFPEKLVRIAWQNNPVVNVLNSEVEKSNLEVKYSQRRWSEYIVVTGNINEFNLNNSNTSEVPLFFPRYNISASINLGTFIANPLKTKVEKENVKISLETINQKKLEIRSEVLQRYQTYISFKEIYDLRAQMVEDALSDFILKEQKFSRGEIVITEYTQALDYYNQQKINKIQSEREMVVARIVLEELIGVKLSDVR
jgi:outer membrane protein TolC